MTASLWLYLALFVVLMGAYIVHMAVIAYKESQPEIDAHTWLAQMDKLADAEMEKRA